MSLERFVSGRIVVLRPDATVMQAARAMEENGIGAVLVGDRSGLVGVVTDRDIALGAFANRADPAATRLESIMSDSVVCLPCDASAQEAVEAMAAHGVRRLPLVDREERPVGILTLDDLLACSMVPVDAAANVLRAQLGKPTRKKPPGVIGPRVRSGPSPRRSSRRAAHAEATYARFLHVVMDHASLPRIEMADRLARLGIGLLCQRIRRDLARHFLSQVPLLLREAIIDGIDGPDRRIDLAVMQEEVSETLDVSPARAKEILVGLVEALEETVSPGQIESVREQLPPDLRQLFRPAGGRWSSQPQAGPGLS